MVLVGSAEFDFKFVGVDRSISELRQRLNRVDAVDLDVRLGDRVDNEIRELQQRLRNLRGVDNPVGLDNNRLTVSSKTFNELLTVAHA